MSDNAKQFWLFVGVALLILGVVMWALSVVNNPYGHSGGMGG